METSTVRRDIYVSMWGESKADAYLAEEGRQQAITAAESRKQNTEAIMAMVYGANALPQPNKPPVETSKQCRDRWLEWFEEYEGEKGALQRIFEREQQTNPKIDRSYIGKGIKKAREEKKSAGWITPLTGVNLTNSR